MKKIGKNQFSEASYKFIKTSILDNKWLVGKKIFNHLFSYVQYVYAL
jgi:hypothetical protein